ncbi:MAG: hypothetical protein ACTSRP_11820 [Candidatus Helarchaeota archaeon]
MADSFKKGQYYQIDADFLYNMHTDHSDTISIPINLEIDDNEVFWIQLFTLNLDDPWEQQFGWDLTSENSWERYLTKPRIGVNILDPGLVDYKYHPFAYSQSGAGVLAYKTIDLVPLDIFGSDETAVEGRFGLKKIKIIIDTYEISKPGDNGIKFRFVPKNYGILSSLSILNPDIHNKEIIFPEIDGEPITGEVKIIDMQKEILNISKFVLFEGTPIWNKIIDDNKIIGYSFSQYYFNNSIHNLSIWLDKDRSYRIEIYSASYSRLEPIVIPYRYCSYIYYQGNLIPNYHDDLRSNIPYIGLNLRFGPEEMKLTEISRNLEAIINTEAIPKYAVLKRDLYLHNRLYIDYANFGTTHSGLALPVIFQTDEYSEGLFCYVFSSKFKENFYNLSWLNTYIISTVVQNSLPSLLRLSNQKIFTNIKRKIFAYDLCEVTYVGMFGITGKTDVWEYNTTLSSFPSSRMQDFITSFPEEFPRYPYEHTNPTYDLGDVHRVIYTDQSEKLVEKISTDEHRTIGADWYPEEDYYDYHLKYDKIDFNHLLSLRSPTTEQLKWEISDSKLTYYRNGFIKRFPKIELEGINLSINFNNLLRNELDKAGGNAWLYVEFVNMHNNLTDFVIKVRDKSSELQNIVLNVPKRIYIYDSKLLENASAELTAPILKLYLFDTNPASFAAKSGYKSFHDLPIDTKFSFMTSHLKASSFEYMRVEFNNDYYNSYKEKIKPGILKRTKFELLGVLLKEFQMVISIGMIGGGVYTGDPIMAFWGVNMLVQAISGKDIFDWAAYYYAIYKVGIPAEYAAHISIWAPFTFNPHPVWTVLNVIWSICLSILISSGISKLKTELVNYLKEVGIIKPNKTLIENINKLQSILHEMGIYDEESIKNIINKIIKDSIRRKTYTLDDFISDLKLYAKSEELTTIIIWEKLRNGRLQELEGTIRAELSEILTEREYIGELIDAVIDSSEHSYMLNRKMISQYPRGIKLDEPTKNEILIRLCKMLDEVDDIYESTVDLNQPYITGYLKAEIEIYMAEKIMRMTRIGDYAIISEFSYSNYLTSEAYHSLVNRIESTLQGYVNTIAAITDEFGNLIGGAQINMLRAIGLSRLSPLGILQAIKPQWFITLYSKFGSAWTVLNYALLFSESVLLSYFFGSSSIPHILLMSAFDYGSLPIFTMLNSYDSMI